jgi:hypothetical protein
LLILQANFCTSTEIGLPESSSLFSLFLLLFCDHFSNSDFLISSNVTKSKWCEGKIAALLQAFGLSAGLCGLANVLQCAWAVDLTRFSKALINQPDL